ncbi:hypothetical protein [Streptomyces sp. CBMA152]|uniref:hypothetical protein n=1 Tax=Streptomyces sp. CBMA152 TaxID=1896312 RepID=UPI0016604D4B|nr:hypothetical protein [Streptomyces sp. CBMA152]MBD0742993.1 hypothetical protein [Streptomyces sp. CBMA152]
MTDELPAVQRLLDAAHEIAQAAPYLAALVMAIGIAWIAVTIRRARRVHAALADRVTVEVVPTSTFDPGEGEIGRWAHQLGRVRQAAAGVPARGSAARLRYRVEAGKMHCFIEGPAQAAAVLAMPGFAEVEIRAHRSQGIQPVTFVLPAQGKGEK